MSERVEDIPCHDGERWTLEQALTWALYLDMRWVEKTRPGTMRPKLSAPTAGYFSADPVDVTWRKMHGLMIQPAPLTTDQGQHVRIPVFGVPDGDRGDEVVIPQDVLKGLDWRLSDESADIDLCARRDLQHLAGGAAYYRRVTVPRSAVQFNFPASGRKQLGGIFETCGPPDLPGSGYTWLSRAAYWIASKGGAFDFLPDDAEVWAPALEDLRNQIASGRVAMIGRPHRSGVTGTIEGVRVAGIEIVPPCHPHALEDIFNDRPRLYFAGLHYSDAEWYKE